MSRFGLHLPEWRLKFERRGLQLHITVVNETRLAAERAREAAALKVMALRDDRDQRFGPMPTQLRELLRRHPEACAVLRHLAMFEKVLRKKGERAFTETPVALLRHALRQLEALVTDWSPKGLAELRSRLAVSVMERASKEERQAEGPMRSNFLDEDKLEVSEASASDFEKAQTDWGGLELSPR